MAGRKIDIENYAASLQKYEKLGRLSFFSLLVGVGCLWIYFGPIGRDAYKDLGFEIGRQTSEYVDSDPDDRNAAALVLEMSEAVSGTPATSMNGHEFMLAIAFFNILCGVNLFNAVSRKREIAAVIAHFEARIGGSEDATV